MGCVQGYGESMWARRKSLGAPQAGPQLFLHLALEAASLSSSGFSQNQLNPVGKAGEMSQDLQLQETSGTIPNLIRGHSPPLGSAFRENPQALFIFFLPSPSPPDVFLVQVLWQSARLPKSGGCGAGGFPTSTKKERHSVQRLPSYQVSCFSSIPQSWFTKANPSSVPSVVLRTR